MGDIWPYGPPVFTTWQAIYNYFTDNGFSADDAAVFAAIGQAEGGFDLSVINDTPGTGDYSVGTFQINYYGSLYSSRAAEFGTPQQLIAGGLDAQAAAAHYIWSGAGGWSPWSTYTSGAYAQYLDGHAAGGGAVSTSGEPEIQEGATGAAVVTLQTDLNHLGASLATDGDFGPLTRSAVLAFQAAHGLAQDGIVGPLTWAAIGNALGAALTPPTPAPAPITTPAPPSEPPGNADPATIAEWSTLVGVAGPELGANLQTLAGYANAIGGI